MSKLQTRPTSAEVGWAKSPRWDWTSLPSCPMPKLPTGIGQQDRKTMRRSALRPWCRLLLWKEGHTLEYKAVKLWTVKCELWNLHKWKINQPLRTWTAPTAQLGVKVQLWNVKTVKLWKLLNCETGSGSNKEAAIYHTYMRPWHEVTPTCTCDTENCKKLQLGISNMSATVVALKQSATVRYKTCEILKPGNCKTAKSVKS